MKKTNLFTIALSLFILASCATSSDVVDGGLFQKRKYNKGFHINKTKKIATPKTLENEVEMANVVLEEKVSNDFVSNNQVVSSTPEQNNKENNFSNESKISEIEIISINNEDSKTENNEIKNVNNQNFRRDIIKRSINKSSRVTSFISSNVSQTSSDAMFILLIILALFLPPLAVFIFEDASKRFWITLILWAIGWGVGWALLGPGLAGVCSLAAVIYALLIVLGAI
jgi:uncharacterized membrane protein YqaE (UPF0057 family)